ncbi:unnamed protein product [Ranitomeya imitator]|uniref:Cubilin n=1 Tax=Ranitomeya imitator TaxID=111125 RepID=A0ABN9MLF2_9NEOB|nr:unnamed protein product [Ranitomeya imitator]
MLAVLFLIGKAAEEGWSVSKPDISNYTCECHSGWNGTNCTENINECASNPCQNGAVCTDGINGYTYCGGVLTGLNGTLSYPSNPGTESYEENLSCSWVIKTEAKKVLRITFPYFNLEVSQTCSFDFLQINDGETISDYMLGKFCGNTVPEQLFSSHNALHLWFKSDHKFNNGGFQINWESQDPVCGGQISETHGSISSPGYPGNYPPNRDCYWTISVAPELYITFSFAVLNLEEHNTAIMITWRLKMVLRPVTPALVRDGNSEWSSVIGKYCDSTIPAPITSSSNNLWIKFKSSASATGSKFRAFYQVACGGSLSGKGVIRSPHYPNPYYRDRSCEWVITQSEGSVVMFTFENLNVSSSSVCGNNYVQIRDGSSAESTLIEKYCGSEVPLAIYSTQRSMYVQFVTDVSGTNHGFMASYKSVVEDSLSTN